MKNKILFLILLLTISFVSGLPHIIGWIANGKDYRPLTMVNSSPTTKEETYFYALRTKQILNGDIIPHDAHLFEHQKDLSPYVGETMPSYIMSVTSKIAGSLDNGFIIADFIFPVVIFLLAYFFILKVTKEKRIAILCGLATVFVRDLFIYFPYPRALINYLFGFHIKDLDLLPITRSFHPEVSFLLFLIALYYIFSALQDGQFRQKLFAGILLGINFYNYIFYWSVLFLGLSILFVLYFKKIHTRSTIIKICAIGILIGLPYLILVAKFSLSPYAHDFAVRSASPDYNLPSLTILKYLIFSLILLVLFRKKTVHVFFNVFLISALTCPILAYIVLGRNLEGVHFLRRVFLPIANIYYFLLIYQLIKEKVNEKLMNYIIYLLSIVFIFYGFKIQFLGGLKFNRFQIFKPEEKQLFEALNRVEKNSVIGTINQSNNLIFRLVTDNFIYVAWPTLTIAKTDELIERNIIINSLFKDQKTIVQELDEQIFKSSNYYFNKYDDRQRTVFRKKIEGELKNLNIICGRYRLDYIVTERNQTIRNSICFKMKKFYINKKYLVYKIIQNNKPIKK